MTIPSTMCAFVLTGHGGMECLEYHDDWPTPIPGAGEVLIRVAAAGINNTDVNTRTGWYSKAVTEATTGDAYGKVDGEDPSWGGAPISFPRIQGGDVAGIVVDGDDALTGQRVLIDTVLRDWEDPLNMDKCGYLGSEADGGFAEYVKVDRRNVHPINCGLSDVELATFAIAYSTAENMLNRGKVVEGDTVLVPGASGGVGSALVQLAGRRGATVIAMASEAKHEAMRAVGLDFLLPRSPENLRAALLAATGGETVSVVADVVGGKQFGAVIDVLERGGRYTCAGAIAGPIVELDLRTFYLRDLTFTGATILPTHIFPDLVGYIERGEIKPLLAATWPLQDLKVAQQAFIDKLHTGNIVVAVDQKR